MESLFATLLSIACFIGALCLIGFAVWLIVVIIVMFLGGDL